VGNRTTPSHETENNHHGKQGKINKILGSQKGDGRRKRENKQRLFQIKYNRRDDGGPALSKSKIKIKRAQNQKSEEIGNRVSETCNPGALSFMWGPEILVQNIFHRAKSKKQKPYKKVTT